MAYSYIYSLSTAMTVLREAQSWFSRVPKKPLCFPYKLLFTTYIVFCEKQMAIEIEVAGFSAGGQSLIRTLKMVISKDRSCCILLTSRKE